MPHELLEVLVVNQYYPPDTSATAGVFRDLTTTLAEAGHRVTVLCGRPSYDPTERRPWRLLARERDGNALVERVGSTSFDRRRIGRRAINYLAFFALAALRVLARPRPDVVVAGSDPPFAVWVALLAARGRPVVYSLQDLHPEFAIASGMIRGGFVTRVWDAVHRAGLGRCSLVVCLGEVMAEQVGAKGVPPERIEVVPDGAWPACGSPDPRATAELRAGSEFVVLHAGNLGGAGAWETLAGAAQALDGGCSFVFVGGGFAADRIEKAGARHVPFRPPDELASVMAAGDLQVISLRRGMEGLVVPSKLYTILAHGRPVLAVVPDRSEVARIVREHRCGLVAAPDDPSDVAEKIRWARSHPAALEEMGRRALGAAGEFERGKHLRRFVRLVEAAAGEGIRVEARKA